MVKPVPTIVRPVPPAVVPDGVGVPETLVVPKLDVMEVMVGWGNVLVLVVAV